MSYSRFGEDSDVYVLFNVNGFFECCMCEKCDTAEEMLNHLQGHIDKGDKVPDHTINRLNEEINKQQEKE